MRDGNHNKFKIGIVCGKLADVDGVSLEVDKWIEVLSAFGHEIYTIAGKYATTLKRVKPENQLTIEKLRFSSAFHKKWENTIFPNIPKLPLPFNERMRKEFDDELEIESSDCANRIFEFIQNHKIDVLIGQNTNAMPMTLLAGMALYKLAMERRVAIIFHHHDFWWERSRFSSSNIEQLLTKIMPPVIPGLEHVVISSYASHVLSCLKRVRATVVPNCEDFNQPPVLDDYNRDFRQALGFETDDILIVQPTRIVPRKKIEDSIQLVSKLMKAYPQLAPKINFIISLYQGDEEDTKYLEVINKMVAETGVSIHYISSRVASTRMNNSKGEKMYTNRDVLVNADIVTYLPIWEGFGNALLEAIAAKVPIVVSQYLVYKTDIRVARFKLIEIRDRYDADGLLQIPDKVIHKVYRVLTDEHLRREMVEYNFKKAHAEFGFDMLSKKLKSIFDYYSDEIRASRKRIHSSSDFYHV